ncbi:hypothetical protein D3C81_2150700 [compost metagenome]
MSATDLPTYCRLKSSSADSGMPSSRIGSECFSTLTPVYCPRVSMPISVTTGLPEYAGVSVMSVDSITYPSSSRLPSAPVR